VSLKQCSLAIEEVKEPSQDDVAVSYEPKLKVLVNRRYGKDPDLSIDAEPVAIQGRITISF